MRKRTIAVVAVAATVGLLTAVGNAADGDTTAGTGTAAADTPAPAPGTSLPVEPAQVEETTPPPAPAVTRPPHPSTRPPTTKPAPALTVQIVSLPPTGQGNLVTATVRTAPAADCAIDVEYKSGPATAAGLDQKTAPGSGIVRWTWKVGTRTTPGDWPVTVTCAYRAASESDQRPLTVLDTGKAG
jgi:hypothetical protein